MSERLIDLDILTLRCRDKVTREYIQEAVACYRAGAFRSCIVSTWNAVVFDYIYKLRQLEISGDNQARDELEKFRNYRQNKETRKLWEFEKTLPEKAQENFEFISVIEREDLERLCEDRNRCAHPSMQSLEEPFQPSSELARYHLRNAVMHFLQYPPAQGKAFFDKIWGTICSVYFPQYDIAQAVEILKSTYLNNARKSLIKSVIVCLTKSLILEEEGLPDRRRKFTALQALRNIDRGFFSRNYRGKVV